MTTYIVTFSDALESYKCPDDEHWKSTPCTATIFATYPQQYLSLANGFLDQVSVCVCVEEGGEEMCVCACMYACLCAI